MRVAVAVITDAQQRILITRRSQHAEHGALLWEFPGGKVEQNETPDDALVREIKEELDLNVLNHRFLGEVNYAYPHRDVSLLVYHVNEFEGDARCCEVQMGLCWVDAHQLSQFEFPEANIHIIELLNAHGLAKSA